MNDKSVLFFGAGVLTVWMVQAISSLLLGLAFLGHASSHGIAVSSAIAVILMPFLAALVAAFFFWMGTRVFKRQVTHGQSYLLGLLCAVAMILLPWIAGTWLAFYDLWLRPAVTVGMGCLVAFLLPKLGANSSR